MFEVKDDLTIYCTRGDVALLSVTADENGVNYIFQPGDVVRMKVFEKKDCQCVVMQKDVIIEETTDKVDILLTGQETRICEVISKPKDFWYEVELNPETNPQTIIGYDEDGPKVFRMFPEGKEIEYEPGEQASFLEELVEKEVAEYLTENPPEKGDNGKDGADGKTPLRGVDYWTNADKAEIVNETAESIPTASADTRGVIKVGNGLKMDGETLNFDNGKWECIEKICFGYELLTEKPADWDTAKTTKYYYAATDQDSRMKNCNSWDAWMSNQYWKYTGEYDQQIQRIERSKEPDGTTYNFKCVAVLGHLYNTVKSGLWCLSVYLTDYDFQKQQRELSGVIKFDTQSNNYPYHMAYKVEQGYGVYDLSGWYGSQGNFTARTGASNAAPGSLMRPVTYGNIRGIGFYIYSAKEYYSEGDYIEIWGVRADG